MVPIISQVKNELQTGSSEVIQSSRDKQMVVLQDDDCTDPTHSMLSKDHFTNVLNEPAGKVASAMLKWVVPQIVAAWDDDSIDIRQTNDRIIHGVMHHPAQRDPDQDAEDAFCQGLLKLGATWWSSHARRRFILNLENGEEEAHEAHETRRRE